MFNSQPTATVFAAHTHHYCKTCLTNNIPTNLMCGAN